MGEYEPATNDGGSKVGRAVEQPEESGRVLDSSSDVQPVDVEYLGLVHGGLRQQVVSFTGSRSKNEFGDTSSQPWTMAPIEQQATSAYRSSG